MRTNFKFCGSRFREFDVWESWFRGPFPRVPCSAGGCTSDLLDLGVFLFESKSGPFLRVRVMRRGRRESHSAVLLYPNGPSAGKTKNVTAWRGIRETSKDCER